MKKIIIILTFIFLLTGCDNNISNEKFYLDDKYYNEGNYIEINNEQMEELKEKKESYLLFTYNSYCSFKIPCDNVFENVMKKYKIDMYSIPFELAKETYIKNTIKYAPSVLIINKGKIMAYLDSEKDEDINKFQDEKEFESWLDKYIYLEKKVIDNQ